MFLLPVWLYFPANKPEAAFGLHCGAVDFVVILQRYLVVNERNVVSWKDTFFSGLMTFFQKTATEMGERVRKWKLGASNIRNKNNYKNKKC